MARYLQIQRNLRYIDIAQSIENSSRFKNGKLLKYYFIFYSYIEYLLWSFISAKKLNFVKNLHNLSITIVIINFG